MKEVSVYKHPDEFPPAVLQLFNSAAATNLECSASWYRNLVNGVFADHEGVRFYVLLDQDRAVAGLPIVVRKNALGSTVEALGNYYTTLYAPLLIAQAETQHLVQLIKAIETAHAPITSMRFAPLDPESNGTRLLQKALAHSQFKPFDFFAFGNWYLPVKNDWPTYLKNRVGTVRSTIKRMGKKFATEGGSLELVQGGEHLERGLAAYQHVYALSWKQPEPYPEFIPGLIRTCAAQGWLRLGVAWLDGQAIAAQLWIVANGKANIYKLAYDENFKAYAPGTLLTAMLMERAIDLERVDEIDYLIGDEPYKAAWMSDRRERWGIVAYNPKTVGGLVSLSRETLGRALKPKIARKH